MGKRCTKAAAVERIVGRCGMGGGSERQIDSGVGVGEEDMKWVVLTRTNWASSGAGLKLSTG